MTVDALNLESGQPNDLLCSDGHQRRQPRRIPVTAMADDRRGAPPRSQMPRHPLVICAAGFPDLDVRLVAHQSRGCHRAFARGLILGRRPIRSASEGAGCRGGRGAMSLRCPWQVWPSTARPMEATAHGHDHHDRWHGDLLQGLGVGPADRVQPRLAAFEPTTGTPRCCSSCSTAIGSSPTTGAGTDAPRRPATVTTWTTTPTTWPR